MTQTRNAGILIVLVVCSIVVFVGCGLTSSSRSPKFLDPKELLIALKQEFPQGVPSTTALKKMEAMGFKCERVVDGTFVYHIRDEHWQREKRTCDNIDFVLCRRQLKQGLWVTYF